MKQSYLLLFCLVALASAKPLPNSDSTRTTKCGATITAKFDDLPTQPPAAVPLPIGPYRGLKYNNVGVATLGVLGSPPSAGVIPASNPNVGSFGFFAASIPNVTVVGGSAGYKTFNPTRIAYGCVVASEQTLISVPASCTLALSGYKAGVRIVRQLVTYEAKGQLTKGMSLTSLQGFGGVDTVRFEIIVPSSAGSATVAAVIDDFMYAGCS